MKDYTKIKKIGFFAGLLCFEIPLIYLMFRNAHWSVALVCTLFLIEARSKQWVKINNPIDRLMDMFRS